MMGGLGSAWVAGRLKVKTTQNLSLRNKDKGILQHATEPFITTYNVNYKADSLFLFAYSFYVVVVISQNVIVRIYETTKKIIACSVHGGLGEVYFAAHFKDSSLLLGMNLKK